MTPVRPLDIRRVGFKHTVLFTVGLSLAPKHNQALLPPRAAPSCGLAEPAQSGGSARPPEGVSMSRRAGRVTPLWCGVTDFRSDELENLSNPAPPVNLQSGERDAALRPAPRGSVHVAQRGSATDAGRGVGGAQRRSPAPDLREVPVRAGRTGPEADRGHAPRT